MSILNRFLEGVRVLDVSAYIPGPLAGLMLADMGADVIKIEPPAGDGMRALGPRDAAGAPLFHAAINAGKRICRLDLKSAAGREAFLRLADEADLLIEGFRPGTMDRLGLGYDVLAARNAALVYCALSGYGATSPDAAAAGHDLNYLAAAGVLDRNGVPPRPFDPPLTDVSGSLFATIALLGALRRRDREGKGCFIDIALADTPMLLQQFAVAAWGDSGTVPRTDSTYLNGGAAYYRTYATREGRHVALAAVEPKFWRAFCLAAGQEAWIGRHADPLPQRGLIEELDRYFAVLTLSDCNARFLAEDCCCSPVLDLGEALRSPHHLSRGLLGRGPDAALQALFPAWVDGRMPDLRPALQEEEHPPSGFRRAAANGTARG